jgi:two-component system NarL family sensor kinase
VTPGTADGHTVRMETSAEPRRDPRWLVVLLGAVTVVALGTAVVTTVSLGWSWADALDAFVLTNAVMGLAFGGCGAVVAWHRPGNAIGWLFLTGGMLHAVAAAASPLEEVLQQADANLVWQRLVITAFVYSWPWSIGLCLPLALLLFPDGRPASPAWRWVVVAVVVTAPLFVLEMGAAPEPVEPGDPIGYLTLSSYDRLDWLWTLAEWRTLAALLAGVAALVVRYRRGPETIRRQLLWLLLALVVVVPLATAWGLVAATPVAVLFCIPLIPLAVTVAIVRHQLLDIRLVVSRAVAWLLLSLAVVVAYAALVAALDRLISAYVSRSALVTVVLVLVAAPTLPRLQRLVDRAMYGDRSDPARVATDLGEQLSTPESGLAGVAGSIRRSLRLPWVALSRGEETLAADGRRPDLVADIALTYGGAVLGSLSVGLREGERRLSSRDRRVLETLAAPLAAAVHATIVSAELQASRERLVGAREEERRRLRRDLHDGLGPALTGIAMAADAAANMLDDSRRARELLDGVRRDARAALADVRRVVEDLRPPVLDELGLVDALRQRAEVLSRRADGAVVRVSLDVPDDVPTLPAAVEVAAYRIATEALTNIARHSRAESAVVRLRYAEGLEVSVTDDGPSSEPWSPGTGLHAMRERAAELGGAFSAGPSPAGGRVRASFPLVAP